MRAFVAVVEWVVGRHKELQEDTRRIAGREGIVVEAAGLEKNIRTDIATCWRPSGKSDENRKGSSV